MTTSRIIPLICILVVLVCIAFCPGNAVPLSYAYAGLYADADHSNCEVHYPGETLPFTMWVWWLPIETGMHTAEYAISYPSLVIPGTVTANPGISESVGSLAGGISVTFEQCQTGWTWTHKQICYLVGADVGFMELIANPASGAFWTRSCEPGNPITPVAILNPLALNASCWPSIPTPELFGVTVQSASAIRAVFDGCVQDDMPPQYFVLHNKADAMDSINVVQAARADANEYDLVLEKAMADNTTYILLARRALWGCGDVIFSHSEFEFTFLAANATENTTWGAIKALFGN